MGMTIDLRKLEDASGQIDGEMPVTLTDATGHEATVPCRVELAYNQAGGSYHFHGDVFAGFDVECHRCLKPVRQDVHGDFDLVVRKSGTEAPESGQTEDGDRDYMTIALNAHEVNLDAFITETAQVAVPMLILCTDDCKGLCSVCGVNRNEEPCKCEVDTDPRWEALRNLGNQDDKTST